MLKFMGRFEVIITVFDPDMVCNFFQRKGLSTSVVKSNLNGVSNIRPVVRASMSCLYAALLLSMVFRKDSYP